MSHGDLGQNQPGHPFHPHIVSPNSWLFIPPSELGNDTEQSLQGIRFVFSDQESERRHSSGQVQRELSVYTLGSPKRWLLGLCCGKRCHLSDEDLKDGPRWTNPACPQVDDHAARHCTQRLIPSYLRCTQEPASSTDLTSENKDQNADGE